MADALFLVDATGALVLTNAAYVRMFGRADANVVAEDASGHPLSPEEQPQHRATAGVPFTLAFTLTAPDGTRRWFEASGQPVVSGDGRNGGVVTIRDITERSLRLLQDEFLALASRELRSPLTALLMALQLLGRRVPSTPDDPDFQTALRLALRQGQRLRVLVNDLLDVGRVQQQKLRLRLRRLIWSRWSVTPQRPRNWRPRGKHWSSTTEPNRWWWTVMSRDWSKSSSICLPTRSRMLLAQSGLRSALRVSGTWPRYPCGTTVLESRPRSCRRFQPFLPACPSVHALASAEPRRAWARLVHHTGASEGARGSVTAASTLGEGTTFTVRLPLHARAQGRRRRAELAERAGTRSRMAGV